jgi:hypothetical protein
MVSLTGTLDQNADGSNTLAQINTTGQQLGQQFASQAQDWFEHTSVIGEILTDDWTKLQQFYANASNSTGGDGTPGAAADWGWDASNDSNLFASVEGSVDRTAYETLFPIGYPLNRLQPGPAAPQTAAQYACAAFTNNAANGSPGVAYWSPFQNIDTTNGGFPVVTNAEGDLEQWTFAQPNVGNFSVYSEPQDDAEVPSSTLLNTMFAAAPGGANPLFLGPLQFATLAYQNGTQQTYVVTHQHGSVSDFPFGPVTTNSICNIVSSPNLPPLRSKSRQRDKTRSD